MNSDRKNGTLAQFFSDIKKFNRLTHEEHNRLFTAYKEEGKPITSKIRKQLIEANIRLVISIAKKFASSPDLPLEDAVQEGFFGLIKAVEKFDVSKECCFSTYARWWISQSIQQHILKRKRTVRLPAHAVSLQKKLVNAAEKFRSETGLEPSAEELAELTGASDTVVKATLFSGKNVISLQQPIGNSSSSSSDGSSQGTVESKLEDMSTGANPYNNVSDLHTLKVVDEVLSSLTPKEAAIIRMRFGLCDQNVETCEDYFISDDELNSLSTR